MRIGAHPLKVFVNGKQSFSHKHAETAFLKSPSFESNIPPTIISNNNTDSESFSDLLDYMLINISEIHANEGSHLIGDLVLIVKNGLISCFGNSRSCSISRETRTFKIIDMKKGIVIPGLIAGHGRLGLEEIEQEKATHDGGAKSFDQDSGGPRGVDGLRVWMNGSLELQAAWKSGVVVAVSLPRTEGILQGLSVAFKISNQNFKGSIVKDVTGVTVVLGNDAKDKSTMANSFAGQIGLIRGLLMKHVKAVANSFEKDQAEDSPFYRVVKGELVLFVEAQEANDMSRMLFLINQVEEAVSRTMKSLGIASVPPKIKVTIVGGAEARVIASELKGKHVILRPPRCTPGSWATRQCLVPSSSPSAVDILLKAGVIVSFANNEDNFIRNLMFEVGWSYQESNNPDSENSRRMSKNEAIGLVTWNAAGALGLEGTENGNYGNGRIIQGKRASIVGYNGDPLEFGHEIMIVADGATVTLQPRQL